jgi:hypothetical protein
VMGKAANEMTTELEQLAAQLAPSGWVGLT